MFCTHKIGELIFLFICRLLDSIFFIHLIIDLNYFWLTSTTLEIVVFIAVDDLIETGKVSNLRNIAWE
jgi:hypothetical protein